jgi:NADPH-dependent 2,4-dienoyl-CoA reductase/sulfur reductase-like enzyme
LQRIVENNVISKKRFLGDSKLDRNLASIKQERGMHLLSIGGSDAGISAALRAKECSPSTRVTVVVADRFPNFSICGLPFFLSGEVPDWQALAHRTIEEIEREGMHLRLNHRAIRIDPKGKTVAIMDKAQQVEQLEYDKLIIATGAASIQPPIEGLGLKGVFPLRWMGDAFAFEQYLTEHRPKSAAILGSGYISMEMADALTRRGLFVSVLARSGSVLKTVDSELGEMIRSELHKHGVRVIDRIAVTSIVQDGNGLLLKNDKEPVLKAELVLVAAGAQPETELARAAGVSLGGNGAIRVSPTMETNVPDIYAAGDCVETRHRLLRSPGYLPLGTTAHKQGRVAGENAAGGRAEFEGSLGTQVVKIFDLVVARTGLRDREAIREGFDPLTIDSESWDHKLYYPGATKIRIRITGDRKTHQLLGAQIVGSYGAEVSKRIDVFAAALFNGMMVEELDDLDLSYTPPLGSPWDPVQMAAHAWAKEQKLSKS